MGRTPLMGLLLTIVLVPLSTTTSLAAGMLGVPYRCPATCGGVGGPNAAHGTALGTPIGARPSLGGHAKQVACVELHVAVLKALRQHRHGGEVVHPVGH